MPKQQQQQQQQQQQKMKKKERKKTTPEMFLLNVQKKFSFFEEDYSFTVILEGGDVVPALKSDMQLKLQMRLYQLCTLEKTSFIHTSYNDSSRVQL
jgi:hypothetical protein